MVQQRIAGMQHNFINKGITADRALQTGYKTLDYMVTKQAAVLSYMDAFLYLGVMFLICIPFVLMVKGNKGNKINPAEAMH
jgi:DHA2 family multidrug resistance protein